MPAKSSEDAVAITLMLYLQHHTLVRFVGSFNTLGHHAIEPGAFESLEPVLGHGVVLGRRGEMDRRPRMGKRLTEQPGTRLEWLRAQVVLAKTQQIEKDSRRGSLLSQELDPRRCR